MKTEGTQIKKSRKKTALIILILILVAVGSGTGYFFWNRAKTVEAQTTETPLNTAQVRRGSLTLSATGSGTLVAGEQADLSFPVSGKVAKVNVQPGDQVTKGQVLAELADITTLKAAMTSAELELQLAQQAVDALSTNSATNLANARIALADAEKTFNSAKSKVKKEGYYRCDPTVTKAYYEKYLDLKGKFEAADAIPGDSNYYLNVLLPAQTAMNKALATYNYCLGYTDYEIETSQQEVVVDQAAYEAAKFNLENLEANNGIDPIELAQAQNTVANAQIAYEKARLNLEGATLIAPFDGTVLTVAGESGDTVGIETFISLIDLLHPNVEFSADETDLGLVKAGADAVIVFDALPDLTFEGTVLRVNPSLSSFGGGYSVLSGLIQVDLGEDIGKTYLIEGLNASVEIISGQTENALLVPLEAVRDIGDGQYAVFVVGANGQPEMRVVEVGLMDATYAEIISGLEMGETVSTGAVETVQ